MIQLRFLKAAVIVLLVTAVSIVLLIARGTFDPKPVGHLVWQDKRPTMTVPTRTKQIEWLDQPVPDEPFSVRLTAVFQEGATDSGYGLTLGDETQNLLIAVSPLGYATIQQSGNALFPWQPWPHVHTQNTPNEIWLDWVDGQLSVRLNRELLWVGEIENPGGFLGLYGESFAETAVFDFQGIQLHKNGDFNN